MCILPLGENGLEKYRLSKKWEQFKIVLLFMDHPVLAIVNDLHLYFLFRPYCQHLTTSFQFWRKLLFFLRKVTYFVLAKQIWIPTTKIRFFSFVKFPYDLATYAEEMLTRIYLHMETLKKVGRKVSIFVLTIRNKSLYSGKVTTYLNVDGMC